MYLPKESGLHTLSHQDHIIAVKDHHIDLVELATIHKVVLLVAKGNGILLIDSDDVLLEMRALER